MNTISTQAISVQDTPAELRARRSWVAYDWANSAFATTVIAGFFPIFFKLYYSAGVDPTVSTARFGIANSIGSLILALISPWIGAIADAGGYRKRFLFFFTWLGILMTAALALVGDGQWIWAAALYIAGNLGFGGGIAFYDALLPSVSRRSNVDYVSALGYSAGYLGGGVLFALNVAMYQSPSSFGFASGSDAIRFSFLSVAIWWAVFSIPVFLWTPERNPAEAAGAGELHAKGLRQAMREGFSHTKTTLARLRQHPTIVTFLIAFFLYNDGVGTTIRMAVDYGMSIGFQASDLILALLLVQFVGFPAAWLFGKLSTRYHPKQGITLAIGVYLGIVAWAAAMTDPWEFYALAVLIGLVQGGIQALSRSYYSRMIPLDRAGEFYGFYNLLGKFTGLLGPALVGVIGYVFDSPRVGILAIMVLFTGGYLLLRTVDVSAEIQRH